MGVVAGDLEEVAEVDVEGTAAVLHVIWTGLFLEAAGRHAVFKGHDEVGVHDETET